MTPSQLAKEYATANGFNLGTIPALKRVTVNRNGGRIAEVSGYPAALNAMKAHMQFLADKFDDEPVQGLIAPDGKMGIPADTIVGEPVEFVPISATYEAGKGITNVTVGIPDECAASGESCSYRPHGINGESQCQYCGKPDSKSVGRWYVSFNGNLVLRNGHASRLDALKLVRSSLGHKWASVRNKWRTARVTIFYLENPL